MDVSWTTLQIRSRHEDVVPDIVQQFVVYFYRHIRERNVNEILKMYETSFNKISERFFQGSPWPHVDLIAPYVKNDHVFCMLYKELYFRHLYAKQTPTLQERTESWENYCSLFGVILHGNVNMVLPNQWLWDMMDEFVYQFQSFCQYRGKLAMKSEEEITMLKGCGQVWNAISVFNFLQALVDKSGINEILENDVPSDPESFTATQGYGKGSNVLKNLGYYSLLGLLRMHCLTGNYWGALKSIEAINLLQPGHLRKIIGASVSLYYYAGFAYMMLRRPTDAMRCFSTVLTQLIRLRKYLPRMSCYAQVSKKQEQLYALLAICYSYCPRSRLVDDGVLNTMKDTLGEKIQGMSKGDEAVFDELFTLACPKFVTPSEPSYTETMANYSQDAFRLQLGIFLSEVSQQHRLSNLSSFLKLYSTISVPKLASIMEIDEKELKVQLLNLKKRSETLQWSGSGAPLDGEVISLLDLDFCVDGDLIKIVDHKVERRYGDFFTSHIAKMEEILGDLKSQQDQEVSSPAV